MPPFRRKKIELAPLSGRMKDAADAAREVAREAPHLAREVPHMAREGQERVVGAAREVARGSQERVVEVARGSQERVVEVARESQERVVEAAREVAREGQERVVEAAREVAREGQERVVEAAREVAREAPQRARELREAVENLDIRWARSRPARWVRENFMRFALNPLLDHYAARRATGSEALSRLEEPVILVANHASHMDTPVILSALPRRLRRQTAVAAAADYFYRNRLIASLVSLAFNTVPIDRKGGGKSMAHLDELLDDGWSLLLYPEGTRKHGSGLGRVRRGAAVLAAAHNLPIVPIRVTGTAQAMPPGSIWPKRIRSRLGARRHRIEVAFGDPIPPIGDAAELIAKVQAFFDSSETPTPTRSPYLSRRARKGQ